MINAWNFLYQPVKNCLGTCNNIQIIETGQGDDYTTGCLMDYLYFKNFYKIIETHSRKKQDLDADEKAIQQINFTGNLDWSKNKKIVFIIQEAKETIVDLSQGSVKVL